MGRGLHCVFSDNARLLYFLLLLAVSGVHPDSCPEKCFCSKTLTSVNCEGKGFATIPKDVPVAVEKLYLDHNQIGVIDTYSLAKLKQLKTLFMRNNLVTTIEPYAFTGTTSLEQLYLTRNHLETIEPAGFANCTSLTFLHLGANSLKGIPHLGELVNLQSLILEGNKLIDVTFPREYTGLRTLYDITLSNNNVRNISGNSFKHLKDSHVRTLLLARSHVEKIENDTFSSLTNLKSLKIGYNPLDAAQLENAVVSLHGIPLVSINIANVKLGGRLPSSTFRLFRNSTLTSLLMPNNDIQEVPDKAFADIPRLNQLDISACKIQTISPTAFEGLNQLNLLFLNDNRLVRIPSKLPPQLLKLYLNGNQISEIGDRTFSNLYELQWLFLANNNIRTLMESSFIGLQNLHQLHLSSNVIAILPGKVFQPLVGLQSLDLSHNAISRIPETDGLFSSLHALTSLNLDNNACFFLPFTLFQPLTSLEYLHLENNLLRGTISGNGEIFKNLVKLKELYINKNKVPYLPSGLFDDLISLEYLDATSNRITHWGKNLFRPTKKLKTVLLGDNLISLVNETSVQDFKTLTTLNLTGNPFSCSCDLRWFRDWVNTTHIDLPDLKNYTCNSPPGWAGKKFLSFDRTKIDCKNHIWEYVAYSVGGTIVISSFLFLVLYRKRWFIRLRMYYLCNRVKRKRGKHGYEAVPGNDKMYDAYISCAEEDNAWVLKHLLPGIDNGSVGDEHFDGEFRLCLPERENKLGRNILSFNLKSISSSKKVLIILSKNFCASQRHCDFELTYIIDEKCDKVLEEYIVIEIGGVSEKNIPNVLHGMMERGDFIQWRENDDAMEHFKQRIENRLSNNTDN